MESTPRSRLVPAGLIALAFLPSLFGALRLFGLARGVELIPGQARFVAAPVPIVLHIIGATTFCILGALQFGRRRASHRWLGWIVAPSGVVAALAGVWMTLFYPLGESDGTLLRSVRLLAGVAMAASIVLAVRAVVRRDVRVHTRWMIRAYALGVAAGTQTLLLLPASLLKLAPESERSYTLFMAAGWIINLAFAEWTIRRASPSAGSAFACGRANDPRGLLVRWAHVRLGCRHPRVIDRRAAASTERRGDRRGRADRVWPGPVRLRRIPTLSMCAVGSDRSVLCWGSKYAGGWPGDGSTKPTAEPTLVPDLRNVEQVAVGLGHVCAVRVDGLVLCWGKNESGQIGDGTTEDRPTPTMVRNLDHVVEIAAGGSSSCARVANGTVWCWGSNEHRALGLAQADECKERGHTFHGDNSPKPCSRSIDRQLLS